MCLETPAGSGLNAVKTLKARDANSQVSPGKRAYALLVAGVNSGKLDDILMKESQASSQVVVEQNVKQRARDLLVQMTSGKLDDILKQETNSKVASDPDAKRKARALLLDLPPLTLGKLDDILNPDVKEKARGLLMTSGKLDDILKKATNSKVAAVPEAPPKGGTPLTPRTVFRLGRIKQKARGLLLDLPPLTKDLLNDILLKTSSQKAAMEEVKQKVKRKAQRLLVEGFNSEPCSTTRPEVVYW